MFTKVSCILLGLVFLLNITNGTDLTDVTANVFPGSIPNKAVIAAYGDYNGDKLVDIFVISGDGEWSCV